MRSPRYTAAAVSLVNLFLALLVIPPGTGTAQSYSAGDTRSPHGSLTIPCQNCHTLDGWKPIRNAPDFDHNRTPYPLRGMHKSVTCTQCHVKPVFTNVGGKCADCHADIHKRQFGAACEQCHSVKGWQISIQQINQHQNRFPLLGAHAAVDCGSCHQGAATGHFQGLPTQCYACHAKDYQTASAPSHVATGFPTTCEQCHRMDSWFGPRFDHLKNTGFDLTGAHASLDCMSCHARGHFRGTSTDCVGCHLSDYQKTNNPSHVALGFPQTCQTCHTTSAWQPARFDHSTSGFPLTGAHASTPCEQCHVNGNYNLQDTACASCHLKDYQRTTSPNHAQAGYSQTCQTCHDTTSWSHAAFDHAQTGFPLTGAHGTTPCERCHVNGNYNLKDTACASCHLRDYQGTTTPNHTQAGYSQTCETCHNTTSWAGASFDHARTGFPLTGAHKTTPCERCHVNGNYNLNDTACVSCHLRDYQGTTAPNHAQAGYSQTCQICHDTTSWRNATFDHARTGFPLTGAHATTPCEQCHVNGNYNLKDTACVSCHLRDYQGTTNPNHVQLGYSQTCQTCHNTTSWGNATFDHARTGFPLTGAHATTPCEQCHVNGNYNLKDTACVSCHMRDYQGATNPNHAQAGFPQTCQTCHDTTSWGGGTFDHAHTGFALTGAHLTLPCAQCHVNGNYQLTSGACSTCHMGDYQGTNDPNHAQAGFPTTCDTCHTTVSWGGAQFNHNQTSFPLTGAHVGLSCVSCHSSGVYKGLPTTCVSCHLSNFNGTTNPNHVQAGFPQQCELCHNTAAWTPSTFNHDNTAFPLTGAHTMVACTNCHVSNNYTNVPTDCYSCHRTDYQNTTNPNHTAAGFPTGCQMCHTTTDWLGATVNHTWFKVPHHGINLCGDCHTNPSNFAVFSCITCHTHNKADTDAHHRGVNGYVYNSANCYACHKTESGR